jgi:phosphinothricin acetyltransferase
MIRIAEGEDYVSISKLYAYYVENHAYSFEYSPPKDWEFLLRMIDIQAFFPFLVYEDENHEILGFSYAHRYHEREAYQWICETSIYTKFGMTGRGIGRALYEVLLPILKRQGFTKALAIIGCPNEASEVFHQKMGFSLLSTFSDMGYKLGQWHDIKTYELVLNEAVVGMEPPVSFESQML